jgi:hypothetical protein
MRRIASAALIGLLGAFLPASAAADEITELVPGTAVLLSTSSSGSGATSSTSSKTAIFSPAVYSDYKRFNAEPTVTVDRYPFVPGPFGFGVTTTEFRDVTYTSAPQGAAFPGHSQFWKSDDLGRTFRVPPHIIAFGRNIAAGQGGGDSHQVVGQVTHKVFFVDLPGTCVTLNTSMDLGETFTPDTLGCGATPGVDDRQWVEVDETVSGATVPCPTPPLPNSRCGNVYISFINFTTAATPTLVLARSTKDGAPGTFAIPTDSPCNYLTAAGALFASDATPTACPDPSDEELQVAGPVVADDEGTPTRAPSHHLYIPFVRATAPVPAVTAAPPYRLYIARSTDEGLTWTRHLVADLGAHNPINIFPQLTVDRGGNLYYVWAQTQAPEEDASGLSGETDVYYAFSTTGGLSWSPPIPLTQENGDSAVFPWMIAGDPGQVDVVFYKSNTGLNPNVAEVDDSGNSCPPSTSPTCRPNPSAWNVFFGQSQNALNTGSNFKAVQISDHPNHIGQICTGGLGCTLAGGDRALLDFFTVDVDHLGAAVVAWSDDNNSVGIARGRVARQLSGNTVLKNQTINLKNSWGITDHAARDRTGDVYDGLGIPKGSCPGMDLLGASADRSGDLITVSLTLNGAPTAAKATACATPTAVTGGLWGAEFWAASASGDPSRSGDDFYVAYRDNVLDGPPRVEAGVFLNLNPTLTALEFAPRTTGTLGGSCFTPSGTPTALVPCTVTMTFSASALGIKPGAGLYSITGLSTHFLGTGVFPFLGNSEHADAAVAFDYLGTGSTK